MWRSAMLTTVPSSMAMPDPRVTVKRVSRPRAELRDRSWSSASSGGSVASVASVASGGTSYLLAQLLGGVRRGPLGLQPVVDLLPLRVAHQPDDVARLRQL